MDFFVHDMQKIYEMNYLKKYQYSDYIFYLQNPYKNLDASCVTVLLLFAKI